MDVIPPSGKYWIGFNTMMVVCFKEREEGFTHRILQLATALLKSFNQGLSDERVFIFMCISTRSPLIIAGPKPQVCDAALSTNVTIVMEYCQVNWG